MTHCSLCRLAIFDHFHISYHKDAWITPPALSLDMQPCCDNSTGPIGLVVVRWSASFPHCKYQKESCNMHACCDKSYKAHKFGSLGVITSVMYSGGEGVACMSNYSGINHDL